MPNASPRKRPCRICRRWFLPNPRLKDRQKTCADKGCQKEWHRRQCADWNKRNTEYFKADYLAKKLRTIPATHDRHKGKTDLPRSRIKLDLPQDVIQEVIGQKPLVIIDYFIEQLIRRYQRRFDCNVMYVPKRAP